MWGGRYRTGPIGRPMYSWELSLCDFAWRRVISLHRKDLEGRINFFWPIIEKILQDQAGQSMKGSKRFLLVYIETSMEAYNVVLQSWATICSSVTRFKALFHLFISLSNLKDHGCSKNKPDLALLLLKSFLLGPFLARVFTNVIYSTWTPKIKQ